MRRSNAMTIGQLSRHTGVSIKILRTYEGLGFLCTLGRSESNYRLFGEEAFRCVQAVQSLRSLGLTLKDIQSLIRRSCQRPDEPSDGLLQEYLAQALARIEAQISTLQARRQHVLEFQAATQTPARPLATTAFEGSTRMNDTSQTFSQPQNPYPYYQRMREQQPVFYDQEQEAWLVFRYAEVSRIFTDHQTFSSRTPCCPFTRDFHSFYRMDPPELQRYRSLVSQPFTPLGVSRRASQITSLVTHLLDRVADQGQMDVIDDLAFPLPLRVMAEVLGLPLQDEERYAAWSRAINGEEMPELRAYFHELLTERQSLLRPGIISSLLEARLDGRPLTEEEVLGFCGQLFLGANAEITPFLGNVVQSLLEHPEVADELRAESGLIPSAIEEMLRFYPPVPMTGPRRAPSLMSNWEGSA